MATTLKEYAENRAQARADIYLSTHADWVAATTAANDAKGLLSNATEALTDAANEIAALRRALAVATTPGEAEALAELLGSALIVHRGAREEHARRVQELAVAVAERDRLTERLKAAELEQAEAERADDAEAEDTARRSDQKVLVTGEDFDDLVARAQALLDAVEPAAAAAGEDDSDGVLIQAARDRVEGDLPEDLRTRARERAAAASAESDEAGDLVDGLVAAVDEQRKSADGLEGAVEELYTTFDEAAAELAGYAQGAPSSVDKALALLTAIVDSEPLSDEERAKVEDADLASAAATALTLEKAVDDALEEVAAAASDVELAIVEALGNDPYASPDDDAGVIAALAELASKGATLSAAEAAFTAEEQANLDAWRVEVPDHIWANLLAYDQALELLDGVANTDRAALGTSLDAAEATLAQALEDADQASLADTLINARLEAASARAEALAKTAGARIAGAARGD